MDRPLSSGGGEPATARARLARPDEVTRWAHSAVDLNGGRVITTELAGPPTAEFRAGALARLGRPIDASLPVRPPFFRLSVRAPYQASPEAWMTGVGVDVWRTVAPSPQAFPEGVIEFLTPGPDWAPQPGDERELHFITTRLALPQFALMLLTIPITAAGWTGGGPPGHISVGYVDAASEGGPPAHQVQIPLAPGGASSALLLDIAYATQTLDQPEFFLKLEAGAGSVAFTHATLAVAPPIPTP